MKKILFFSFFLIATSIYSQSALHSLLQSLKGVTETHISKSNRTVFYLGDEFSVFNSNKVIEVFQDINSEPQKYIIPVYSSHEYNVYIEIPNTIFQAKKNIITFNAFGSYLIFDKKNNSLYRINSESACGTVYKKSKKILVVKSYYGELTRDIFVVDKRLANFKQDN